LSSATEGMKEKDQHIENCTDELARHIRKFLLTLL